MAYVSTPENFDIVVAIVETIRSTPIDTIIPRKQLDNLLKGKLHLLAKARRQVEREDGVVIATIIGVGIKKLDPRGVHVVGVDARRRASKGLGRAQGRIVGVIRNNNGELSANDRLKASNEINKLGLAVEFCKD